MCVCVCVGRQNCLWLCDSIFSVLSFGVFLLLWILSDVDIVVVVVPSTGVSIHPSAMVVCRRLGAGLVG